MSDSQNPGHPSASPDPQPPTTNVVTPKQSVGGNNPAQKPNQDDVLATKRELHFLEKLNIFANLSLVAVGIYAACIYHGQLTSMQGQLAEMESSGRQTDQMIGLYRKQVEQLTNQASDTHQLAVQALAQANTARQAFEVEARPYVGFRAVSFKRDDANRILTFGGTLSNSGRIPATQFMVHYVVMRGETDITIQKRPNAAARRFLNPGEQSGYLGGIANQAFDDVATGTQKLDIYVSYTYHWRHETESKCEKAEYDPRLNLFLELGEECPPHAVSK